MRKLVEKSRHWEMVVRVGNDWGEPEYIETREYYTKEELDEELEDMDYYDIPLKIKDVVEYEIKYVYDD